MKQAIRYILFLFILFGANPLLKAQTDGLFFSMTYGGGNLADPIGVINRFDPLTNRDTAVINFNGANGYESYGNFIQLQNGLLYGMTAYNGVYTYPPPAASGTILQYNIQTGKDSVLYIMPSTSGNYDSGEYTYGSLCHATNDLLYGLTYQGGILLGSGVLFSFNYHTGVYRVLVQLRGRTTGANPTGTPLQINDSMLYCLTTSSRYGIGKIFSYNINTGDTVPCHEFMGYPSDGSYPQGSLMQASDGLLYGLTEYGGTDSLGTLFRFDPGTNTDTIVVNFNKINGAEPQRSLIQASDGNLYGTTYFGGLHDSGTIFSYNIATKAETLLYSFGGSATTGGYFPAGDLMQASDGLIYGTTLGNPPFVNGKNNWGTIFSYNISTHTKKTLSYFNDTNGEYPNDGFLEAMSASVAITPNMCPNDSAGILTINARGYKAPLTYSWSTGATTSSISNLKAGIYTDTVWDARGIKFVNIDSLRPLPIVPTFNVSNACFGMNNDSVSINVTGGTPPYTYLWSNGKTTDNISGVSTGTYTCTVTDHSSCSLSKSVVVSESNPMVIDSIVAVEQTYPFNNGKVTVYASGGVPPGDTTCYYYLWNNGEPDSATISNLDSGTYVVCVTSCYGCGSACSDSVKVLTATHSVTNNIGLVKVYPVPSTGLLTVNLSGNNFESLEITDALGMPVYDETLNTTQNGKTLAIDLSSEPNGVYILYARSRQGISTQKIIIQK